jgi:hypothetical protein
MNLQTYFFLLLGGWTLFIGSAVIVAAGIADRLDREADARACAFEVPIEAMHECYTSRGLKAP